MVWLNNLGFADPYGTTSGAVDALFSGGARDLGNGLRVVRIGDDDERMLSAVIECLAVSECGTTLTAPDPLLDWVYHPRDSGAVYKPLAAPPSPTVQCECPDEALCPGEATAAVAVIPTVRRAKLGYTGAIRGDTGRG